MAQWLRALSALPGDPGLIPSTHLVLAPVHSSSPRGFNAIFWAPWAPDTDIKIISFNEKKEND